MRAVFALLGVIAVGGLAGCATPTGADGPASTALTVRYDEDRMARINREAKFRGVEVHWINPPTKREEDR